MAKPATAPSTKVTSAGWMKDSSAMVVCTNIGCTRTGTDGKDQTAPAPGDAAKADAWPYADDLVLTWQLRDKGESLDVGAVIKNDAFGTPPLNLPGLKGGAIFPEAIVISPDGKWLGAVAHATAAGQPDLVTTRIAPIAAVAGRAYNFAGLKLHERGDYKNAIPLLLKGAFADPAQTLAPYNLACALARVHDPRTQAALALAFERDATLKKKAESDKDLDGVRAEPWFAPMLK
jgi:hypothetical protein